MEIDRVRESIAGSYHRNPTKILVAELIDRHRLKSRASRSFRCGKQCGAAAAGADAFFGRWWWWWWRLPGRPGGGRRTQPRSGPSRFGTSTPLFFSRAGMGPLLFRPLLCRPRARVLLTIKNGEEVFPEPRKRPRSREVGRVDVSQAIMGYVHGANEPHPGRVRISQISTIAQLSAHVICISRGIIVRIRLGRGVRRGCRARRGGR